jgi:hypothetical protein
METQEEPPVDRRLFPLTLRQLKARRVENGFMRRALSLFSMHVVFPKPDPLLGDMH